MQDTENQSGQVAPETPMVERQRWMGVLARASSQALSQRLEHLGPPPPYDFLRPPEPGSVMVRARAGGAGAPFHLGEMTVTRCSIRLPDGLVGHAYVQGRDRRHAELAALADAMLQDPARRSALLQNVIEPLAKAHADTRERRSRKAAATQVDFFTLVRGESPR